MNRLVVSGVLTCTLAGATIWSGCSTATGKSADQPAAERAPIAAAPVAAVEQPIARFIRATGSLMAEDQADVAAEIAGRVVATPVERGTAVTQGDVLIRLSPAEADAQASEAEANAAQIEARLGLKAGIEFDVEQRPGSPERQGVFDLAQNEFNRIKSLLDQRVVSQSEFDQRRTQMEAARQQYESAKNGAAQQYQALQAARARVALAHKSVADTVVRAPFTGLVAERLVSTGDYVTKGMKVAVVVRVNPLRVQLTVPEQFVSAIAGRRAGHLSGRRVSQAANSPAKFDYVSPALKPTSGRSRSKPSCPIRDRELKPGLFATARIEQPDRTPAVLVPASAVQTTAGTSRVFIVNGDHVEERIVTVGQTVDAQVEISNGLKAGERVATTNVAQLTDGAKVS